MANIPMITEIDVLQYGHGSDFSGCTGKRPACLPGVVAYRHKPVVKLRENRFDSFAETPVGLRRSSPVLPVQPVGDFKFYVISLEKVLLHVSTQIPLIPKHKAVVILPPCIVRIMYVTDVCSRHVIRVENSAYSTDSVEFISVITHLSGSAEAFSRCVLRIVIPHSTTPGPCHFTDLYRFGICHGNSFPAVYTSGNILTDLLRKTDCKFTTNVELSSGYEVRDAFGRFSRPFEEVVLAVLAESFGREGEGYNFHIGKDGDNSATGNIAMFVYTILRFPANCFQMSWILMNFCDKVVHAMI